MQQAPPPSPVQEPSLSEAEIQSLHKYSMKLLDRRMPDMSFWTIRKVESLEFYSVEDIFNWLYAYYSPPEDRQRYVSWNHLCPRHPDKIVPSDALYYGANYNDRMGEKILCVDVEYIPCLFRYMNMKLGLASEAKELAEELDILLRELQLKTGYIPLVSLISHKVQVDKNSYKRRIERDPLAVRNKERAIRLRRKFVFV